MKIPAAILNNGVEMPRIGLGTYKIREGEECFEAVKTALSLGYRLIDTASYYRNEGSVGSAIKESGIARKEIFITTKLWPTDYFNPRKAFEKSLAALGFEYVDLYLIHWPAPLMPKSVWQALEKIYEEKLARAIGVSNYDTDELRHTLSYAKVVPAVNQVRFNTFDYKKDLVEFCTSYDIAVEAYSPLARGAHLNDPTIASIAKKYGKTPAQVMLRWCIERGTLPIPKSVHPSRLQENLGVFDWSITAGDLWTLDALS